MKNGSGDVLTDEDLVRVVQSDPDGPRGRTAASELLGRYRVRTYAWCYRHVRDHELALDLAQDALLSAWKAIPRFVERARFSSWLFAIARNRCLTALRTKSLTRDEGIDPEQLLDDGPDPIEELARRDEEEAVMKAIREVLDPQEQEALWLRAVERVPVDEITRLMNLDGASGARGLLQTARRKLRAAMARREGGSS